MNNQYDIDRTVLVLDERGPRMKSPPAANQILPKDNKIVVEDVESFEEEEKSCNSTNSKPNPKIEINLRIAISDEILAKDDKTVKSFEVKHQGSSRKFWKKVVARCWCPVVFFVLIPSLFLVFNGKTLTLTL